MNTQKEKVNSDQSHDDKETGQTNGPPRRCRYKFKNGNCDCKGGWVLEGFGLLSWCELRVECEEEGTLVFDWCPMTW